MFNPHVTAHENYDRALAGLTNPVWEERHAAFLREVGPAMRERQITLLLFIISALILVVLWCTYFLDHTFEGSGWALGASALATLFTLATHFGKRLKVAGVEYRHDIPYYEAPQKHEE